MERPFRLPLRMLSLLLTLWLAACSDTDNFQRYVAVIDAGSSGSRIYLYERSLAGAEIQVKELYNQQGGEALSNFENTPAEAGPKGVQPLIDNLAPKLDELGIRRDLVQVHLLATAGMRLVEQRSASAAASIYDSARNALSASRMSVGRVETLTGQYEGVYSWADVNYLSGTLSAGTQTPIGIVEVGGASAQVAYPVNSATANDSAITSVSINGRSYRVFSVSWLGLGQNEARRSMIASNGVGSGTTNNACYPDGPAGAGGLTAFNADIGGYTITSGAYNFAQCSALYGGVLQPFKVGTASAGADFAAARLIGVSSVYYALDDWRALNDPAVLDDNLTANCEGAGAWGGKVSPFLNGRTNKFAQNSCANSTFVNALLFGPQGLGVNPAQFSSVPNINGQSLSWTRGFAVIGR